MTPPEPLTDEELAEIEELAESTTPGPWFVRQLDDDAAMSLVAISTVPDTGRGERWPDFDHHDIVAATLVQDPRYVDVADERWDENAQFIANARHDVPRSYLALTHATDEIGGPAVKKAYEMWNANAVQRARPRTHAEVTALFDGLDIVEPGIVSPPSWRPAEDAAGPRKVPLWAGVARKP